MSYNYCVLSEAAVKYMDIKSATAPNSIATVNYCSATANYSSANYSSANANYSSVTSNYSSASAKYSSATANYSSVCHCTVQVLISLCRIATLPSTNE